MPEILFGLSEKERMMRFDILIQDINKDIQKLTEKAIKCRDGAK